MSLRPLRACMRATPLNRSAAGKDMRSANHRAGRRRGF